MFLIIRGKLRVGTKILPITECLAFEKITPEAYLDFEIKTNPHVSYFEIFMHIMDYSALSVVVVSAMMSLVQYRIGSSHSPSE